MNSTVALAVGTPLLVVGSALALSSLAFDKRRALLWTFLAVGIAMFLTGVVLLLLPVQEVSTPPAPATGDGKMFRNGAPPRLDRSRLGANAKVDGAANLQASGPQTAKDALAAVAGRASAAPAAKHDMTTAAGRASAAQTAKLAMAAVAERAASAAQVAKHALAAVAEGVPTAARLSDPAARAASPSASVSWSPDPVLERIVEFDEADAPRQVSLDAKDRVKDSPPHEPTAVPAVPRRRKYQSAFLPAPEGPGTSSLAALPPPPLASAASAFSGLDPLHGVALAAAVPVLGVSAQQYVTRRRRGPTVAELIQEREEFQAREDTPELLRVRRTRALQEAAMGLSLYSRDGLIPIRGPKGEDLVVHRPPMLPLSG